MEKPDPGDTPPANRLMSVAHLLSSVSVAAGHIARHTAAAKHATSAAVKDFNIEHVSRHTDDLIEHLRKLTAALREYPGLGPGFGEELDKLMAVTDPDGTAAIPERSAAAQRAYAQTMQRLTADVLYSDGWGLS